MIKKLLLILVSLGILLLLSGCTQGSCSSSITITDANGAGTRTLTFSIDKDIESLFYAVRESDDSPLVFVDSYIFNNSTYFPKGYQAFADFVMSQLPENGYTVSVDESRSDSHVYITFSYSFDSLEEYTEKTKALMGEDKWAEGEFVAPRLYVSRVTDEESGDYGNIALTFAESHGIGEALAAKLIETGFSKEAVEAGVLSPYGNSFTNPDCLFAFEKISEGYDTFYDYANMKLLATPANVCSINSGVFCSFMGEEDATASDIVQITKYVEDDGSYELTGDIPEYLGAPSFPAVNATEEVDGETRSVLSSYAPGKDSLATLPDISTLRVIVSGSGPSAVGETKILSSDKTMEFLIDLSFYIVCGCVIIGVITGIIRKTRKNRR